MVHRIQTTMAVGYSAMGAWCVLAPASVITLSLTSTFARVDATTMLLMQCFGAQAVTTGLLLGTATMTAASFKAFGLAMLPYLGFNVWFGVGPGKGMFTPVLGLDFVGNIVFALGSAWCVRLLEEREKGQ